MGLEFISSVLLPRLLSASLQALLMVAVVLLLCRLLPRLAPAARALLWWLVALQLVVGVVWSNPLALPLLPAEIMQPVAVTPIAFDTPVALHASASPTSAASFADLPMAPVVDKNFAMSWHWSSALAMAWLLGLSFMIARTLGGYLATRRLLRESKPCEDRNLLHALQLAAEAHGLNSTLRLRLSSTIDSPQLIGPWRPVLLLPANYREAMHADELDMALTHELVHLQRGDLWWGLVPAAAQHLFFFHPLAHLAAHEYALAREAACDAAVIAGNRHCAHDYGRLLVRLGVAPRPSAGLASASPTFRILKRRLLMLQNTASMPRMIALAIVGVVAILGVMPYRITAATAPKAPVQAVAAAAAVAPQSAAVAPTAGIVATAATAPVPATSTTRPTMLIAAAMPPAPEAPEPPLPPEPPALAVPAAPAAIPAPPAPPAPSAPFATRGTFTFVDHGNEAYALLSGDHSYAVGSTEDLREAQRQRSGDEEMLWVRKGKARYVVRDPATLRQLQALHNEMSALGRAQARIGEQQGKLGEQQGALGLRQAEIAAGAARIAAERATQAARDAGREAARGAGAAAAAAELAEQRRMDALDARQRGLSDQMRALSDRQVAFGREQAALGEKQAAASAHASREANRLIEQAIKQGLAQPISQ